MKMNLNVLKEVLALEEDLIKFSNTKELHNLEIPDDSVIVTSDEHLYEVFKILAENKRIKVKEIKMVYPDKTTEISRYDKDGNMVTELSDSFKISYEYDSNGNLTRVEMSGGYVVTYEYDKNNNLIKKSDNYETTTFFYDENNNLIKVETDNKNIKNAKYNTDLLRIIKT